MRVGAGAGEKDSGRRGSNEELRYRPGFGKLSVFLEKVEDIKLSAHRWGNYLGKAAWEANLRLQSQSMNVFLISSRPPPGHNSKRAS